MSYQIRRATAEDKPEWLRMRQGLWPEAPIEYLDYDLDEILADDEQAVFVAAGADGIIVEVHPRPEEALCDGPQQIPADEFGEFARDIVSVVTLMGKTIG